MRPYGTALANALAIALAIAAMLAPGALRAQAVAARPAPAPASAAPAAALPPGDEADTTAPRPPRSLMGLVMGALIHSAEQSARREREAGRATPASPSGAQGWTDPTNGHAGTLPPRHAAMPQVAIGTEP